MSHPLPTVLCLILLSVYVATICRLYERRLLFFVLPAMAVTACLIMAESVFIMRPWLMHRGMKLLLFLQVLLCPAWLVFSLFYARKASFGHLGRLDRLILFFSVVPLIFALILPASAVYYQTDFTVERVLFLERGAFFFYLSIVILLLLAVGQLESTLRSSLHSEQWRIKLAMLGAGVVVVSLGLYFSQGLLFKAVDMNRLPLRNIAMSAGLLIMLYAEWRRKSASVILSRKIVFRSLTFVVAGLYLLLWGIANEHLGSIDGKFARIMLYLLVGGVAFGGLLLLMSNSFRRKLSIWIQRKLYDEKYDYRGQWILFSERLAGAGDKDSFIQAALLSFCNTFGRVGAFFIPVAKDTAIPVGAGIYYEMDESTAREIPLEEYAPLLRLKPVPVRLGDRTAGVLSAFLTEKLEKLDVSLFMPIWAAEKAEGILFMGKPIDGREQYDMEDFELMEAMGKQVGLCVRSFRQSDELATAREVEALGKLGTFVLHDLKNQVYALSLLLDNAKRFISDPTFQKDMLETLGNTVANMNILITQLTHLPSESNMRLEPVDLHELVLKACNAIPDATLRVSGKHPVVFVDQEQICKLFTNLCLNAVEASNGKPVHVEIDEDEVPLVRVSDEGGGIAPDVLRQGLFKPFSSTKQHGMGIGLYHSRKIAEAHGASIGVNNRPGVGCTFTVRFDRAGV